MPEVPKKAPAELETWKASPKAFAQDFMKAAEGLAISHEARKLMCAHAAISSAWGKSAGNYRLAGVKVPEDKLHLYNYTRLPTREYNRQTGQYETVQGAFQAFDSLIEGVKGFYTRLQQSRYAKSLALLQDGNPDYFYQLSHDGWYTAPPSKVYRDGMETLHRVERYLGEAVKEYPGGCDETHLTIQIKHPKTNALLNRVVDLSYTDTWGSARPDAAAAEATQALQESTRTLQQHLVANAQVYENQRAAQKLSKTPKYVLSNVGLVDHPMKLGWSYLPPPPGSYRVWPKGKMREWSWLILHTSSYFWDNNYLILNPQEITPPGDKYGHNPQRWFSTLRAYCGIVASDSPKGKPRNTVHGAINRKGEVVWLCDINDAARHMSITQKNTQKNTPDKMIKEGSEDNDACSVGIVLEAALKKFQTRIHILPFTERQIMALAVVCKKLETFRPTLKRQYFHQKSMQESFWSAVRAAEGGYLQHKDVKPQQGIGGQFDIPPGSKGLKDNPFLLNVPSGWDQLWQAMDTVRTPNVATDIFISDSQALTTDAFTHLSNTLMKTTDKVQRAFLSKQRDRLAGQQTSLEVQGQARRKLYKQAMQQAATQNSRLQSSTTDATKHMAALASKMPTVSGDILMYNFATGRWLYQGTNSW